MNLSYPVENLVEKVVVVMPIVLDVGCGGRPTGDVNVDLIVERTGHRDKNLPALRTGGIPNFILASAEYLPLRNECFQTVYCSHTIEHVEHPFQLLKELLRVSSSRVTVKCPFWLTDPTSNKFHKNRFSIGWFVNALRTLGISQYQIEYSKWKQYSHRLLPLFRLPFELIVEAYKT
jgi:SAM-dependent methyltransferase